MAKVSRWRLAWRALRNFRLSRDTLIFLAGLGGIFHETVMTHADRPNLILLFGAMLGLPAFLRTDEFRRSQRIRDVETREHRSELRREDKRREREWLDLHGGDH